MKILLYFFTLLCGLFGLLALVRLVEVLASGGGIKLSQIVIAIVALTFGWLFLNKARAK